MKLDGKFLLICAFHAEICGTAAFSLHVPKGGIFQAQKGSYHRSSSTALSAASSKPGFFFTSSPKVDDLVVKNTTSSFSREVGSDIQKRNGLSVGRGGRTLREFKERSSTETVQGGSLRTWSFASPYVERVQVLLNSEGRPLNANVELWQGPDNTPQKMQIYSEDGSDRPVNIVVDSPRGSNSIAVRNTSPLEFPMDAIVEDDTRNDIARELSDVNNMDLIQGGAIRTYPFSATVESVRVYMRTDGRPLNARIEMLQGPNNVKQVIDLYTEDGLDRPFYAVMETPGTGNVVRIVNSATLEYPLSVSVESYRGDPGRDGFMSGGGFGGSNLGRPSWLN